MFFFSVFISLTLPKLLGLSENASNDEIYRAFRVRALEVHPDKNPEDKVRATKEFQRLADAKIVLLDPEKRRNLDESLNDNGARNWYALPLLCSVCTEAKSKAGSRCLKGKGHINPLIDEYESASKEYKNRKKYQGRDEFSITLQEVLTKFVNTDFQRLYPLIPNRKQKPSSSDLGTCLGSSGISCQKSSVPSAADVVKIIKLSLVRESNRYAPLHPASTGIPLYDLSSLSGSELGQILQYFGLPSVEPHKESVIKELTMLIPKCTFEHKKPEPYQPHFMDEILMATYLGAVILRASCQQCRQFSFLFLCFPSCFACKDRCCWECISSVKRKMPTSGSYDLRSLCKKCLTNLNSRDAAAWLTHGQYLLGTDKKFLEAALAMYNLSSELYPSETAIIEQARALFICNRHQRLVRYGKDVLLTATFDRVNARKLQKMVAESLMNIADNADDYNLLRKAEKYEEVINWTAHLSDEIEPWVRDLKTRAMRGRLHCFEVRERVTKQRAQILFSHLTAAVREGSLLKVFTLLKDVDEEADEEAKGACLNQLSTETPDSYSQYGKLLLRLAKTTLRIRTDPAETASQIADIFWTGYSLFIENGSREHIFNFVSYFTCQLLKERHSLLLGTLHEITPNNFLQCLHLSEDDIISPPDIGARHWENVCVEGCDMKLFLKYELAVKKLFVTNKWSPVRVALSYYDLVSSCMHPSQVLVTLITSAQWFARQMSLPNSDRAMHYSCKEMIFRLTNLAAALSFEFGIHPHLQYYVARMVSGLQFYASCKAPCGSQDNASRIKEHLNWLVTSGRLCPLNKMPVVSPTESVILHIISQDLYSEYLITLQDELPPKMRPMPEAILRYHIYENHWLKRCELQNGDGLRLTAMTELLHSEGWSWDGVQQLLQWNLVPLDSEGWLVSGHQLLEPVASSGIHQLVGLEINKNDFSIRLLTRKQKRRLPSLLSWQDIAVGFTMDSPQCFFSLEAVTPRETLFHPFNKQIFMPKELQASRFLNTLFHTDYLLKQFSTGFEISLYPPFHKRPAHEGLLKGLPSALQKVLLSIPSRGPSRNRVHRFWIQADAMEYDVQENDDSVRWLFGDVDMTVRCKPMFRSQDGELHDQEVPGPDPDSPEGKFTADFTTHYDQIGKYFPEFLRLKELCKVQWLGAIITWFEKNLEEQTKRLESREMDAKYCERYASDVQEAQSEAKKQLDGKWFKIRCKVGLTISDEKVQQIYQEADIPVSYHEFYDWLRFGDSSVIAKKIACKHVPSVSEIKQQVIDEHAMKLRQYQRSVSALKNNCKECLPSSDLANGCCWVPAVCHRDDGNCIYGGVSLMPNLRKVTLRIESDIGKVLLSPSFGFHETVKNPPVKPFNPPRTKGIKALSRNGGPASGPPVGDSGSNSSSSYGEDCKNHGNRSGKGGNLLKNIIKILRKICPR